MTLRIDEDLETALTELAEAEGLSKQEVVRRAVLEKHARSGKRALVDGVLDRELVRYADALKRLGSKLQGQLTYLDVEDLLHIAERTLGATAEVGDLGLLDSAAQRPRATAFGEDAYPDLETKGAALLQSIVGNHALIDGNKRLGLAALITFLGINGHRLTWTNDEAYDFVLSVASSELSDLAQIADGNRRGSGTW